MSDAAPSDAPRWQPVSAIDRRVLGVLVEKAKTTPDAYPLSINALVTGANQKNNREPVMELQADAVEESLDRLRQLGAIALVQGSSRVDRYRHLLYEWLGVDKVEVAVMAELLLRGAQTEGELRGRAARMEPIADLTALRPILDSLKSKGLLISLSPAGRGHVVSHALYTPRELERLQAEFGSAQVSTSAPRVAAAGAVEAHRAAPVAATSVAPTALPPHSPAPPREPAELAALKSELRQALETIAELQESVAECRREIRELRDALGA
ncbi:MAG: DUF480 domain-containing protein [Planctomycetaceae bacterium]|nr:DUF480 domain-containing protein [Planctomycetaceae bacterium]